MNTEIIAAIIGGVATAIATIFSALAGRRSRANKEVAPSQDSLTRRLREVEQARDRQRTLVSSYRWANNLLTFGQFIIGGVLASSFVQSNLSKEGIGTLGVLVLLSSLVRQHYRPDVQLVGASQRAARLQGLLRAAQDEHAFQGLPTAMPKHEIQRMLTKGLAEIEDHELHSLQALTVSDTNAVSRH